MTAVEKIEREGAVVDMTPMSMIDRAVAQGASIETIEKLMSLQERWEANQGRKAFDAAMSAAKSEIDPIIKNRGVDFTSSKGRTSYRYEDLAQIAQQINPVLSKHGLSYRYNTEQNNGTVTVTCIVSHRDGYSERNSLTGPVDQSGNKNAIQGIGSTVTFLQRYTLKAALGLAVSADDDGARSDPPSVISAQQMQNLREKIEEVGADIGAFCNYFRVDALKDLPAARLPEAERMLAQKMKARADG